MVKEGKGGEIDIPDCASLQLNGGARDDGRREDALLAAVLNVLGDRCEVTVIMLANSLRPDRLFNVWHVMANGWENSYDVALSVGTL